MAVGDLKKLIPTQTRTDASRFQSKSGAYDICFLDISDPVVEIELVCLDTHMHRSDISKDHITLSHYKIHDGVRNCWYVPSVSMALPNNASSYLHDRQYIHRVIADR
jgi:hypothetical protein